MAGWSNNLISQTVKEIKNSQVASKDVKDFLNLKHVDQMYRKVDTKSGMGLLIWAIIVFLFSTLLRVSHVVVSPHTLLIKGRHTIL